MDLLTTILVTTNVAFALALALSCVLLWNSSRKHEAESTALQRQNAEQAAQLAHLGEQREALSREITELRASFAQLQQDKAKLEALHADSQAIEAKLQTQLPQLFENIGNKVLKQVQTDLETRAKTDHTQRQEDVQANIQRLLKPLTEMIQTHEQKVAALAKEHQEDKGSLKNQLEALTKQTQSIIERENSLIQALKGSKGRGDWGELELIRLLEDSGLVRGVDYEFQAQLNGQRPDVTVKLPDGRILYIDAKTVLMNLHHMVEADNEAAAQQFGREQANELERQIRGLNLKAYQDSVTASIDFVVLFLPRESMLRVALEEKPALMELAFQQRVMLASPLILMAMLKSVAYSWHQAKLSQRAEEIQSLAREIHKKAADHLEQFEKVGKKLDELGRTFESGRTKLVGRQGLVKQVQKLEAYGCPSEKALPGELAALAERDDERDKELPPAPQEMFLL